MPAHDTDSLRPRLAHSPGTTSPGILMQIMCCPLQDLIRHFREVELGGRVFSASYGSAPTSPDVIAWFTEVLGFPPVNGFGSTEGGMIMLDNKIQRSCVPLPSFLLPQALHSRGYYPPVLSGRAALCQLHVLCSHGLPIAWPLRVYCRS